MISLVNVSKMYDGGAGRSGDEQAGAGYAVRDVSLEVAEGETMILLGPSGCGKTTTLKMINRLIEMSSGTIKVGGKDIREVDAVSLRRTIGYVIQNIGLFPHMTVSANVGIVPRLLGWDDGRIEARAGELLELVDLPAAEFGGRFPAELSGGQQQRVGVARALAADPPVILLDEPFGALDPITREQLQGEFKKLKARLGKTMVFVTHDVFEAVALGDRVCIMKDGVVMQAGTPEEIVERPANSFVEEFLGRHRYQLRLAMKLIRQLFPADSLEPVGDAKLETISDGASLIEALEFFEESGKERAAVCDADGKTLGALTRARVLEQV